MDMTTIPFKVEELLAETVWLGRLARQLVADPTRAEDLAQDALVSSREKGGTVRGEVRPWLTQVARRWASRYTRAERRRRQHEGALPSVGPSPSASDTVAKFELHRHVVEAVESLDERYRETVLLRFWEGLPPREIAKCIEVPVETVKTRLARGLAMLRKKLDAQYGDRARWAAPLGAWFPRSRGLGLLASQKVVGAVAVVTLALGATWAVGAFDTARGAEGRRRRFYRDGESVRCNRRAAVTHGPRTTGATRRGRDQGPRRARRTG